MSDKYFVDTSILMYAHDTAAGAKHGRAKQVVEQLWGDRTGVVSTDALVIQAAHASGAEVVYSEDFSENQKYCGVTVVNPLAF